MSKIKIDLYLSEDKESLSLKLIDTLREQFYARLQFKMSRQLNQIHLLRVLKRKISLIKTCISNR